MCYAVLVAVFLLGAYIVNVGKAQVKPVLKIEPSSSTAEPGQTFTVNVTVSGISQTRSLYSWNAYVSFDQQIINCEAASGGAFLGTSGHEVMWLTPQIDNTKGRVDVGALLKPTEAGFPPNGAFGDGVLATITFEAVSRGTTSLHLSSTEMYSVVSDNQWEIDHDTQDGSFSNGSGLPFGLSLEIILIIAVVVIVVAAGGFLLYRRRRA